MAAFVSSNAPGAYGPWPLNEGLCTLEMHRGRFLWISRCAICLPHRHGR
ncbi:MAG: MupG family TIM beta-alpha barrel fold protein [Enterocloster bolteae]